MGRLRELLAEGLRLPLAGEPAASVEVRGLDMAQSSARVLATARPGPAHTNVRSLEYSIDVHVLWAAVGRGQGDDEAAPRAGGSIRVYNITEKTCYQPGGEEATSFNYALAYDREACETDAFTQRAVAAAHGLFAEVSRKVSTMCVEMKRRWGPS